MRKQINVCEVLGFLNGKSYTSRVLNALRAGEQSGDSAWAIDMVAYVGREYGGMSEMDALTLGRKCWGKRAAIFEQYRVSIPA